MVGSECSRGTFRKMAAGTCGRKDRNRLGRMDTALRNLKEGISYLTPQSLSREVVQGSFGAGQGRKGADLEVSDTAPVSSF